MTDAEKQRIREVLRAVQGVSELLREATTVRMPDGRITYIDILTYGRGDIVLGEDLFVSDRWTYATLEEAILQYGRWDGTGDPVGWTRHMPSCRRRPDGDPDKEYVAK